MDAIFHSWILTIRIQEVSINTGMDPFGSLSETCVADADS